MRTRSAYSLRPPGLLRAAHHHSRPCPAARAHRAVLRAPANRGTASCAAHTRTASPRRAVSPQRPAHMPRIGPALICIVTAAAGRISTPRRVKNTPPPRSATAAPALPSIRAPHANGHAEMELDHLCAFVCCIIVRVRASPHVQCRPEPNASAPRRPGGACGLVTLGGVILLPRAACCMHTRTEVDERVAWAARGEGVGHAYLAREDDTAESSCGRGSYP
ncbi:hypothetical protein B0H17DRAFT_1338657 [Mycena rosella]|uniref:Uncharacterized protein n=1 Tax=Mycena rosella TaxID=1033263 RepID=A0AAD7CLE8_MYCRO|nr:hypothetical protein B0H17DRAFT_1338657 [Mycena rosella]